MANGAEIIYLGQHWGGHESLFPTKAMNKSQVRDPVSGVKSPVASQTIFLEDSLEGILSKNKVRKTNPARTLWEDNLASTVVWPASGNGTATCPHVARLPGAS